MILSRSGSLGEKLFRKSLAASELEKQKETMKQILAEAEKELEQGASPLKQQQEEEEKVEEEEENVEVVEEEEEVRRASVSTVELDDTETHILPSASFLGTYTASFTSNFSRKFECSVGSGSADP
jgi:hypothetical protein